MKVLITRDDSEYLEHFGIKGMKWGVWNEETRSRRNGGKRKLTRSEKADIKSKKRQLRNEHKQAVREAKNSVREANKNVKQAHKNIEESYKNANSKVKANAKETKQALKELASSDKAAYRVMKTSVDKATQKSLRENQSARFNLHYDTQKVYRKAVLESYKKAYSEKSLKVKRAQRWLESNTDYWSNYQMRKDPKTGRFYVVGLYQ